MISKICRESRWFSPTSKTGLYLVGNNADLLYLIPFLTHGYDGGSLCHSADGRHLDRDTIDAGLPQNERLFHAMPRQREDKDVCYSLADFIAPLADARGSVRRSTQNRDRKGAAGSVDSLTGPSASGETSNPWPIFCPGATKGFLTR